MPPSQSIQQDSGLMATLGALGLSPSDLIAIGGEACVFSYGSEDIARVNHEGTTLQDVRGRIELLSELGAAGHSLPFAIPTIHRLETELPRLVTIEPRLPGVTLQDALRVASPAARESLITSALGAAEALGTLPFTRPWFGDLVRQPAVRSSTWRGYLEARAAANLKEAGGDFLTIDPASLAAPFGEPERTGFVHLDLYAGNFLVDEDRVTAVIDFGGVALHGDPSLDLLSVAVYLRGEMTDSTHARDSAICAEWLRSRGLLDAFGPAERWLCAMWSFATNDPKIERWCRRVLLPE